MKKSELIRLRPPPLRQGKYCYVHCLNCFSVESSQYVFVQNKYKFSDPEWRPDSGGIRRYINSPQTKSSSIIMSIIMIIKMKVVSSVLSVCLSVSFSKQACRIFFLLHIINNILYSNWKAKNQLYILVHFQGCILNLQFIFLAPPPFLIYIKWIFW